MCQKFKKKNVTLEYLHSNRFFVLNNSTHISYVHLLNITKIEIKKSLLRLIYNKIQLKPKVIIWILKLQL
jgi:hypothetical protein